MLCAVAATAGYALAQQSLNTQPSKPGDLENVPRVPGMSSLMRGVNGGITYAGAHNSTIGWYEVMVPAVSYSFSEHYSADASATIYLHRLVQNQTPATSQSERLVLDIGDSGDTLIGLHGSFHPKMFDDLATVSLTAPTGNRTNGLGTGRVTFDFSNRVERFFGRKGVHLDLGIGDSSAVANSLLMRDYNTLGALAHFDTGVAIWLKRYGFVQTSAYEQLPIGSQKVYELVRTGSNSPGSSGSQATEVLISSGVSEDNGLTTSFGIPVSAHILFSGYYNRSLRQHQDTVSLGMTFVVRSLPGRRRLSMIDRALREAAGLSPEP
ncbi:MAG: hypothetical protein P4L03_06065 [Terracidiphilus sp.]|nr:hypothetical protein [Terracidiphilus sp.]